MVIFISYSHKDRDYAHKLAQALEQHGLSPWIDDRIDFGAEWPRVIQDRLDSCTAFIVVMTPRSYESVWVHNELSRAQAKKKLIFPLLLEGDVWLPVQALQYVDVRGGKLPPQDFFEKLPGKLPAPPYNVPKPRLRVKSRWKVATAALLGLVWGVLSIRQLGQQPSSTTPTATTLTAIVQKDTATNAPTPRLPTATASATFTNLPATNPPTPTPATPTAVAQKETATNAPTPIPPQPTSQLIIFYPTAPATGFPHVTANNQWKPQFQTFDGVEMAQVPPGCFMMGSDDGENDEKPVFKICLGKPFWIDKAEVTQAQFEKFGGKAANRPYFKGGNRPVEQITWFEARDFCAKRGAHLLTEAEWEYAARGPDNLVYPWGDTFDGGKVIYNRNSSQGTANVGSIPTAASWVGALDMSGNVWEWVNTIYMLYPYNWGDGRETNKSGGRVLRGGSWYNDVTHMRAAGRSRYTPSDEGRYIGFRCARIYK